MLTFEQVVEGFELFIEPGDVSEYQFAILELLIIEASEKELSVALIDFLGRNVHILSVSRDSTDKDK